MKKPCVVCGREHETRGKAMHCSLACRIIGSCEFAESGCFEWVGAARRYGAITINGKAEGAHRAAWMAFVGEIPPAMFVCHECDNPLCCNPSHLFLGSPLDNVEDAISKGRHGMTGKRHSAETKRKLAETIKAVPGMLNPPEKRKQQSEMMKARWRDDPQWKYR